MRRLAAAAAALALLAACSSTEGLLDGASRIEYKSAQKLPPLDVPPDLTAPARDDRYQVPDSARAATTLSGYQAGRTQQARPGTTSLLPSIDGMRVERAGDQRWLVVNEAPDKLWPVVKSFWQENGFLIAREMPEAGVVETEWAENRAKIPDSWVRRTLGSILESLHSTGERDKYRARLEPAPGGGTEIYISHRGLAEVFVSEDRTQTAWQPRPPDPELEAEFLRRLMVRLGAPEGEARTRVANAQPAAQRATLKKGLDGAELLEVLEPFDRAWRRVGLALDRVGFTVEDRDRQKGVYFVRYADPQADLAGKKDEGLLSRLAFWRDDTPRIKAEQYRVSVTSADAASRVQVLDKDGAAESSSTASRILALLHEQLK
ncbi:MAG: outer membrane protein assembly factor BamC [Betaproteobacteria bacterium]|nr:outer membrane protein assembly factor BamC [Betaproteobacteria bacterium]